MFEDPELGRNLNNLKKASLGRRGNTQENGEKYGKTKMPDHILRIFYFTIRAKDRRILSLGLHFQKITLAFM
jgi:hypothetical protein